MTEICPNCGAGLWRWYGSWDCPNCHWTDDEEGWPDEMSVSEIDWALACNRIYYWIRGAREAGHMTIEEQDAFLQQPFQEIEGWED